MFIDYKLHIYAKRFKSKMFKIKYLEFIFLVIILFHQFICSFNHIVFKILSIFDFISLFSN